MTSACEIKPDSRVTLHYALILENGIEADSSHGDEPLCFVVGDGTLLAGLENLLLGMRAGQQATFMVTPEQGFGQADAEAVYVLAHEEFPADMELAPGVIVDFTTPAGDEVPGTITAIDERGVTVDFNHPLAGHVLRFDVHILAVEA